jgi:hypothetical protein
MGVVFCQYFISQQQHFEPDDVQSGSLKPAYDLTAKLLRNTVRL